MPLAGPRPRHCSRRRWTRRRRSARSCQQRVLLMDRALLRFPGNLEARDELGSVWICTRQLNFSVVVPSLQRPVEALRASQTAEDVYLALLRDEPSSYVNANQLGTIAGARMIILQVQDRVDEAVAQGRRAVSSKQAAFKLALNNMGVRNILAVGSNNFGNLLLEAGLIDEALSATTRSQYALHALVRDDANVRRWAILRSLFAMNHGRALLAAGRPLEAVPPPRESIAEIASAASGGTVRRRGWARWVLAQALMVACQPLAAATEVEVALQD